MRDYVTIERNTPTQGSSGEEIDSWATLANTWCFIRAMSGDESIVTHKISMRYRDLVHTDRIVFGSRIFDIISVIDSRGQGRELVLEAKENV